MTIKIYTGPHNKGANPIYNALKAKYSLEDLVEGTEHVYVKKCSDKYEVWDYLAQNSDYVFGLNITDLAVL